MGVHLLRSYIEHKDLYKNVQVPVNQSGKARMVVFDAPGALRSFLRPSRKGLLYDFHQQQAGVRSMVRAFKQQGYELVVFLDCAIPDDKLTTWYRRRAVEANTLRKLNQHLAADPPKSSMPDGLWLPPNTSLQMLGDAFSDAGCKVFFSFDDSDKEAAYWAKQNGAYAIITDDTDFLCYEGVERIWAANVKLPNARSPHTNIRVSELQRQKLLDSLGLTQLQLQQLAGLLGNDHIKHISKDKITQLKQQHPNTHVVAALAKQVLELQPALGASSSSAAAAAGPIDPAVKQLVAAAVAKVTGKPVAAAAAEEAAEAAAADDSIEPAVSEVVEAAIAKAVAAADGAGSEQEEEEHHEEEEEEHHEEEEEEEEEEQQQQQQDDEEEDAAAAADAGDAAAAGSSNAAAAASSAAGLVDRCKRAMAQYGCNNVKAPVAVGSGDRWLLQNKGIMMRGMGVEDMSKTPCHVLLGPLRLAVYASMGLSSVTEYMCVPDEKWKEWAAGRVVNVPPPPAAANKKQHGKQRRNKGKHAEIDPVVKKVVAAIFANVVGAPSAAAEPTEAPAAAAATEPAAAAVAEAAAAPEPAAEPAAAEAAAAEAPAAVADDIHPAVRKLVSSAMAKAVATANKLAQLQQPGYYEPLPKSLPQKPLELASFIVKRLRTLDPCFEQLSKRHEKLLLLQVSHRQGVLSAVRAGRVRINAVRLPDLHAANMFLQGFAALQIAADGKLPKITSLLHVEAFHALCQNADLAAKVEKGPNDAQAAKQAGAQGGRQAGHAAGGPGGQGGRGAQFKQRGMAGAVVAGRGGQYMQQGVGQRGWKGPAGGVHPQGRQPQQGEGRGRRADGLGGGGAAAAAGGRGHGHQQQGGYVQGGGRGRGQQREGYQIYQAAGAPAAGAAAGRGRGQQHRGEPLTWQQRQHGGSHRGTQQQGGYNGSSNYQAEGYQQYQQGAGYPQYEHGTAYYQQYGAYGSGYGAGGYGGYNQGYGQQGTGAGMRGTGGYNAYGSNEYGAYQGAVNYGYQQYSQGQYGGHQGGGRGSRQMQGGQQGGQQGAELTWQQQQMVGGGRRQQRGAGNSQGRQGAGGAASQWE